MKVILDQSKTKPRYWAHDTDKSGPDHDVPVVYFDDGYPWDEPGWHEATNAELDAYEAYWNAKEPEPPHCDRDGHRMRGAFPTQGRCADCGFQED